MTRILGIDLITGNYYKIQFAACLVDTINNTSQLYEELLADELIDLLSRENLDILAIDHVNELKLDQRIISYLTDIQHLKIVELSQYGVASKSLHHLAKEVGITLKRKPNAIKSAIICSLLAEDHGRHIQISHTGGKVEINTVQSANPIISSKNPLNKRVKANKVETTHRQAVSDLTNSTYISEITNVIGYGKEAIVYRIRDIDGRDSIAKTFRMYSSIAKRIYSETYKAKVGHIPLLMARDEAKFLHLLHENDIPVPKLYYLDDNTVIMEAITEKNKQIAVPLSQIDKSSLDLSNIQEILFQGLDYLYQLFDDVNIVHGDFSANNLLVTGNEELHVIDLSQAMQINTNTFVNTPLRLRMDNALDTVFRDLDGFLTFFEKQFRVNVERDVIFDQFLDLIPDLFADKVEFITQIWSEKFLENSVSS